MNMKPCGSCAGRGFTSFRNEALPLHNGVLIPELSGERCVHCGEIHLDSASMERYGAAGDTAIFAERRAGRA